jgi:hypothetical protein
LAAFFAGAFFILFPPNGIRVVVVAASQDIEACSLCAASISGVIFFSQAKNMKFNAFAFFAVGPP